VGLWSAYVAARRSTYKKLGKSSPLYKAKRKVEKAKAQVRAKVEHPFRVIKRQFGYTKVRADIYWRIQERCACNAGNGRREVLAAAKNPERMDDSIVF